MKISAWFVSASILTLVAASLGLFVHGRNAETQVNGLRKTVQRLSEKVDEDRSPVAVPAVVAAPRGLAVPIILGATADADDEPRGAEASKAPEVEYADLRAYWQTSFSTQGYAAGSSSDTTLVREVFGSLTGAGTRLTNAECRQTLCRAELTHRSEADLMQFMQDWSNSDARLAWKGAMSGGKVSENRDGSVTSVIHLARDGADLPIL